MSSLCKGHVLEWNGGQNLQDIVEGNSDGSICIYYILYMNIKYTYVYICIYKYIYSSDDLGYRYIDNV